MKKLPIPFACIAIFIVVLTTSAQSPSLHDPNSKTSWDANSKTDTPSAPHSDSLTVEKALTVYGLSGPSFSPDGKRVAFVVTKPASGDKLRIGHIWLLDLKDSSVRQYTNSEKSESNPKWSPTGKTLAFTSARSGENQVYLLENDGGEALPLTSSKTGVALFEWSPDGKHIAYTERDSISKERQKRKDDKYDEIVYNDEQPSVLLDIDVTTKVVRRLHSQNWRISNLKWMPAGDALILEAEALPGKEIPQQQLVKYKLADSSCSAIPSPANFAWGGIEIAPDGKSFSFTGPRVDGPVPHDLFLQPLDSGPAKQALDAGPAKNLTAKSLDRPVHAVHFLPDGSMTAIIQDGAHSVLRNISVSGDITNAGIEQNVSAYSIGPEHQVVFVSGAAAKPAELWLYTPGHSAVQLTHFNKSFDKISLGSPELIKYKSFDGTMIEAQLYTPAVHKAGPLAMVVFIHGGPTGAFEDNYSAWPQLFLQKGYAVMMPNIRGSTGYGWKFLESNRNDWGGGDFKDIMAGVDYLIANKNIDSARLAIVGWSYGGYMSEWAITQTNRFKAAMSGAGLFNLASEFGTESGAAYDHWFLGTPYGNNETFTKHSAMTFIKNAHTPTLIIQGENDNVDPVGQSEELYRALRYYDVPAELVLYPNENHGFVNFKHNVDWYTRMLDWIGKYCPASK